MVKPLIIQKDNQTTLFDVSLLDRRKLYGSRKRVALDTQARVCRRASLTGDGALVLVSGSTGQGYFTETGAWVERRQMVPINDWGQVTELHPSTLGIPQKVEGPIEAIDILNLDVQSIYSLTMLDDELGLKPRLDNGVIFKCPFNYSSGVEVETAYLVANSSGYFAIVGHPVEAEWCAHDQALLPPADAAFREDDLDFDMF
jgi:hypothetical protein